MGISVKTYALVNDEKAEKMKQIYKNCEDLGIEIPTEVDMFFGGCPDFENKGHRVDLKIERSRTSIDYEEAYKLNLKDERLKDAEEVIFVISR